jgi:hypothetical protein
MMTFVLVDQLPIKISYIVIRQLVSCKTPRLSVRANDYDISLRLRILSQSLARLFFPR